MKKIINNIIDVFIFVYYIYMYIDYKTEGIIEDYTIAAISFVIVISFIKIFL